MKKTIFCAIFAAATIAQSNAATTITASNYTAGGVYANQVLVNSDPFVTGSYMIGNFTTTTGLGSATGDISLATYGWTQFGNSVAFNTSTNQKGLFQGIGATGTLPTSTTGLVGQAMYLVVANPTNTDFIIWNTGKTFAAEIEGIGGSAVSIKTDDVGLSLLRGTVVVGGTEQLGASMAPANGQNAVTFGVVPEPSAALLGCLGVLGLLRRRRI